MEKMDETQIPSNHYISPEDENKDVKSDFVQWSIVGDGSFCPSSKTLDILSPGLYERI